MTPIKQGFLFAWVAIFLVGGVITLANNLLEVAEENQKKRTYVHSTVGTAHAVKCIDGINYLTKIGTVKIDPDTLLPETCE